MLRCGLAFEDMGPMGPFIVALMIAVPTLLLVVLAQRFWRSYKASRKASEKMAELEREFLRIRAEAGRSTDEGRAEGEVKEEKNNSRP